MSETLKLCDGLFHVGVNDRKIDLFEGQYVVENGMAYNSYLLVDEKVAVMDPVEKDFSNEWLDKIDSVLGEKSPDYLIISHMEPDHSSSITSFMEKYPSAIIVSSAKAFTIMKNFYGTEYENRRIVVGEKDTLNIGKRTLTFITAPMVHWPEVMVTYDEYDKTLFSADAFGKFGATDADEDWACEARRYYFGIVGKYGDQVQALLKKLAGFEIDRICSLHGPVLSENLGYYLNLYNIWSSYGVESEGVAIFYTSVYGHTKEAALKLAEVLKEKGAVKVAVTDLAREDMAEAVEDAFRYGKAVFATTTYNMDIFPFMRQFIEELKERNYKNRKIGFIENGSWAPIAAKKMTEEFSELKNITFCENVVKIKSALSEENFAEIERLAEEILK